MTDGSDGWNGERVRKWLQRRLASARLEQAAADRRGYEAQADYDTAAAEEWVCRALQGSGQDAVAIDDRAAFAARIRTLLAQDAYLVAGIYDDDRFDRSVRAALRRIARMTKAGDGFSNTFRYQS